MALEVKGAPEIKFEFWWFLYQELRGETGVWNQELARKIKMFLNDRSWH